MIATDKPVAQCVKDAEHHFNLIDEYFDNRADADGDSEGFWPNEEMTLQTALGELYTAFQYLRALNREHVNGYKPVRLRGGLRWQDNT